MFIEGIRKDIVDLLYIRKKLEALDVGEERNKFCDKEAEILIEVSEKRREVRKIYRKYLINEPFENIREVLNTKLDSINNFIADYRKKRS